ncbi:hypothetical protein A2U01_0114787, partial [Trifolium medium]|nr:hypothetical protein [Trifolium medium]
WRGGSVLEEVEGRYCRLRGDCCWVCGARCDFDFVSFPFGECGSDFKFLTGFIFPSSFFHGVDYY